jgi:hypothetical protein
MEYHASDCALHNEPALPAGPCNCYLSGNGTRKPEPLPANEGYSEAYKDFVIWAKSYKADGGAGEWATKWLADRRNANPINERARQYAGQPVG